MKLYKQVIAVYGTDKTEVDNVSYRLALVGKGWEGSTVYRTTEEPVEVDTDDDPDAVPELEEIFES